MEHLKGFTWGFEKLRGVALETVGTLFTPKQEVDPSDAFQIQIRDKQSRSNIEYVDEMYEEDHFVPRSYPDLDFAQDDSLGPIVPPVSQSFIDVPINSDFQQTSSCLTEWTPDLEEENDFLLIESTKIAPSCTVYYLPFSQSLDMCNRKVQNWLQQTWFLPSDWRISLKILQPKPQYVPFFVYDVTTATDYEASVLMDSKLASSPTRKWEAVSGKLSNTYNEIIACASCSVNNKLVNKLLKFPGFSYQKQKVLPTNLRAYKQTIHFSEVVLPLEINKDEAWEGAGRPLIAEQEERRAREDMKQKYDLSGSGTAGIRDFRADTRYEAFSHYVVFLPVYFVGFEYSADTYEVVVSGNLGVVVGNRPVGAGSGGKFLFDKIKSVSNLVSETVPL